VKRALTIGLAGAALAATLTFVTAGSFKRERLTDADALPAYEIVTTVRAMGLNPISEPVRRGPYYVLHAYDPRGIEVRVVADAQFGDVLSVVPARALNTAYAPNYERGPRIIHVPQPGEREDRASVNDRDQPAASNDDDEVDVAPLPRRRAAPPPQRRIDPPSPPQRRSAVPPPLPPGPRRAVLSAPPPPAEGPTPVYPTPRYNSKTDSGDKFGQPADRAVTSSTPPVGYTPPVALPQNDQND
jgi:hypothetical protein